MAPRVRFTPEMIINAAISLWEQGSFETITARKLAGNLNATTSIIYRNFPSLLNLKHAAIQQLSRELERYLFEQYSEAPLLNPGAGITLFALNEPGRFLIFLKQINTFHKIIKQLQQFYRAEMGRDIRFSLFSESQREQIWKDLWRYSFGTATMIATTEQHYTDKALIEDQIRFGKLRLAIAFQQKHKS